MRSFQAWQPLQPLVAVWTLTPGFLQPHPTGVMGLDDADVRYLAEIANDCAAVLGPGVELIGLEPQSTGRRRVRLVARYRLGDRIHESVGTGRTLLAAHVALRRELVAGRLALGFSALVVDRRG